MYCLFKNNPTGNALKIENYYFFKNAEYIALLIITSTYGNLQGWSKQSRTDKETKAFVNIVIGLALLPPPGNIG